MPELDRVVDAQRKHLQVGDSIGRYSARALDCGPSETKADQPESRPMTKGKAAARHAKGKAADQPHLSKKAKKVLKERKEIAKEMHEAAAEVDKEDRAANVSRPGNSSAALCSLPPSF